MSDTVGITKRKAGGKTTVNIKGVRFHGIGHDAPTEPEIGIKFRDLSADQCRYPITRVSPHGFCGAQKIKGKSYCDEHFRVAYLPPGEDGEGLENGG